MSLDINIDNDEWIEIEYSENKPEYEPGSIEYIFKQKIISNKNNNNNNNNNSNKLSESFESSKGSKSIKSPSPVVINPEHVEGFPSHNLHPSWTSIPSNFDVKSIDSFSSINNNNNDNNNNNNNDNNNNNVKKQGNKNNNNNKVPFSWAEITKIGQLPGEKISKPKIRLLTNSTNKIKNAKNINNNNNNNNNYKNNKNKIKKLTIINEENIDLPEADPNCTKHDLGRSLKHKRFGKKGNRVKYPNGRRGTKRNSRRRR